MHLVPAGHPIPTDHHIQEVIEIPALDMRNVARIDTAIVDVTMSADGPSRRWIPGPTTVYSHDGRAMLSGHESLIKAAFDGGGVYNWIAPNELYWVQTKEEYDAELERELEADYDYDW